MTTEAGQNGLAAPRVLIHGVHKIRDGFAVAHGSATVRAYDSATVHTRDAWCEPTITVADQAVWIDRRKGFSVHYST